MFYRLTDEGNLDHAGVISAPDYELSVETKDNFTYPKDGWYWFDTETAAKIHLGLATQVVSMRQARLALLRTGLLTDVNNALSSLEGNAGEEARITWEYATEVVRSDALVLSLAQALNWTDTQIDNLFDLAKSL